MLQLVLGDDETVAAWVAERLPLVRRFEKPKTIGIADDGGLIAAVVYHNYYPVYANIEMSIAATSPRWATRGNISALFWYPFRQLGCRRVTALCAKQNKRARKLNEGVGFKLEGVVREGFGSDDACVYGMLRREAARWIGEEDSERFTRSAQGT